jgi:hypothetical protein
VIPGHEHSVLVEAAGTVGGHILALIQGASAVRSVGAEAR